MHAFLSNNRDELIARCRAMVARRPRRVATPVQLSNGIPIFLEQLIETLRAEGEGNVAEGVRISGPAGGDIAERSLIGVTATAHGHALHDLGYTVDQVVHDYGDLCQAVTGLAIEHQAPLSSEAFQTLNRCLDNAIADAVTAFSAHRDVSLSRQQFAGENERLGLLVHELRNSVQTITSTYEALESGVVPIAGATGGLLKRNLGVLSSLLDHAMGEVRVKAASTDPTYAFSLAAFIADAESLASIASLRAMRGDARLRCPKWTPASRSRATGNCCSPPW